MFLGLLLVRWVRTLTMVLLEYEDFIILGSCAWRKDRLGVVMVLSKKTNEVPIL